MTFSSTFDAKIVTWLELPLLLISQDLLSRLDRAVSILRHRELNGVVEKPGNLLHLSFEKVLLYIYILRGQPVDLPDSLTHRPPASEPSLPSRPVSGKFASPNVQRPEPGRTFNNAKHPCRCGNRLARRIVGPRSTKVRI